MRRDLMHLSALIVLYGLVATLTADIALAHIYEEGSGAADKGRITLDVTPKVLFVDETATITASVEDEEDEPADENVRIWIPQSSFDAVTKATGQGGSLVESWKPQVGDAGKKTVNARIVTNTAKYDPYQAAKQVTVVAGDLKLDAAPLVLCPDQTTLLTATLESGEDGVPITFTLATPAWSETTNSTNGVATQESEALSDVRKYTFTASTDSEHGSLTSNTIDVYLGSADIPGTGDGWPVNDKLLIGAKHNIRGIINPSQLEYHWRHDGGGTFSKNGMPNAGLPLFTAPKQATQAASKGENKIRLAFGYEGDVRDECAAERSLNITRPLNAVLAEGQAAIVPEGAAATVSVNLAQVQSFSVINTQVDYDILDQFNELITESDQGIPASIVRIKECLTFNSPKPLLQTWLRNKIKTGNCKWKDPSNHGRIEDQLKILNVPVDRLTGAPPLANGMELIKVESHVWHVSVNDVLGIAVTKNIFTVTVQNWNPTTNVLQLNVKYEVILENN